MVKCLVSIIMLNRKGLILCQEEAITYTNEKTAVGRADIKTDTKMMGPLNIVRYMELRIQNVNTS